MKNAKVVCSRTQARFIEQELSRLNRGPWEFPLTPDTKEVRELRAQQRRINIQLSIFDKKAHAARQKQSDGWNKRRSAVRKLVLFGSPQEALAALERLVKDYEKFGK